jgi:effector-binding domain-containing protein
MTAPVIAENNNNEWSIAFVMPKEFTIATLPVPNNQNIKITALPKEKFAVVVFSGLVRESSYNKKANLLIEFIKKKRLTPLSSIQIARYNPPWTLPFFRRNELMVKID